MRLHQETFSGRLYKSDYKSPVGLLGLVASDKGLRAVLCEKDFDDVMCKKLYESLEERSNTFIKKATQELDDYFRGDRDFFTVPLDLVGTEFQLHAWQALCTIPFGKTASYSEQAQKLGSAKKSRAVGAANGRNPVSIIVPCHRVIGKSGALTGFAGGLAMKSFLLELERSAEKPRCKINR